LMRDIPVKFIIAGCKDLALRGTIKKRMDEIGIRCRCIRCREYGHRFRDGWAMGVPQLTRLDYETEGGREIFLSFEDINETLFGLLRLRIKSSVDDGDLAIIRELHVFGPELVLAERRDDAAQHRGLGVKLLREAERIASEEFRCDKIDVLSGVGVRDYYRSLGYHLDGSYMVKRLT
jgi:elongator complex protein 3